MRRSLAYAVLLLSLTSTVAAMPPSELFAKASPSVVVVETTDAKGKRSGQGSGVVVGPGLVVTNCHVLKGAAKAEVLHKERRYRADLRDVDVDRDLCSLDARGLVAPAAAVGTSRMKVGERVYTIGAPQGLELTLGEGLLSSRRGEGEYQLLQVSAPISPGSSGGGLFDEAGRLVGITTMFHREGQALNFAVPVEWIAELPARHLQAAETAGEAADDGVDAATAAADAAAAAADAAATAADAAYEPQPAPRDRWVEISDDGNKRRSVDSRDLERRGASVTFWVRDEYGTPELYGSKRVSSIKSKWEAQCGAGRHRFLGIWFYDKAGKVMSATDPDYTWETTIPDSVAEEVVEFVCEATQP